MIGYEVVPLCAMLDGYRTLALRDGETGARLHFAQLQLRVKTEQVGRYPSLPLTPDPWSLPCSDRPR